MLQKTSRFISYFFHPVFIPFITLLCFLNKTILFAFILSAESKLIIITLVLVTTIILPLLIIYFLYKRKIIRSLQMESREDRVFPLLITAIFYYLTHYLLKGIHASFIFSYYMEGLTFLSIGALLISFYRKISLHMIGWGGLAGMLVGFSTGFSTDMSFPLLVVLLISGIVGTARLALDTHKPSEIYSGFLLGAGVMFFLFILL